MTQSYCYVDLLSVMCVCNDVAISDNQTYIAQKLLSDDPVRFSLSASIYLSVDLSLCIYVDLHLSAANKFLPFQSMA